jgi:endonuclease-3
VRPADRALRVVELLELNYPSARTELDHEGPWQLLVATILSAQSTDVRVNQVTPRLFECWPTAADLAAAELAEVEGVVRPVGMFRQKAAAIVGSSRMICEQHGGEVPADLEELAALPGVGRKTAKVVLGEAAGVTVDTHVRRLANRLGLTELREPEKIAADLEKMVPQDEWITLSTRLILHGRRVCSARSPKCDECALAEVCPKVGVAKIQNSE